MKQDHMAEQNLPELRPVVTRDQAMDAGLKRYFTGEPCPRGHVAERSVSGRACVVCAAENSASWRSANPEKAKATDKKHKAGNRDRILDRRRKRRPQACRHCGKEIAFREPEPDAKRASRPKYCSDHCRLYSKVAVRGPDECWLWQGAKHSFGYGLVNVSGKKAGDIKTSHGIAWEVANGRKVPAGMYVCHSCDVPACCNPAHLWLGTPQDNYDDMIAKGRHPNCR